MKQIHNSEALLFFKLLVSGALQTLQNSIKGKVHLILPVTKDRLSSLLETQNNINFGLVKTCMNP